MRYGLAQATAAVAAAFDALREIDPRELTDAELPEFIVAAHAMAQQAAALEAQLIGEFDARGACREAGALSTKAWLEHNLRMSPGDATAARRAGRTVRALPEVAAAFAAGQTSARHVDLIGRAAAKHGADAIADYTEPLLTLATTARPQDLRVALQRIDNLLDPDGATDAEMRRQASRHLRLVQTLDGMWHLEGLLSAEDGEVLRTVLIPLAAPVKQPDNSPDPRSAGERYADAFVEAFTLLLGVGKLPEMGGEKPHVTLVVDLPSLRNESIGGEDNAATALWGASLGKDALQRLCCDAAVAVVVADGAGCGPQGLDPETIAKWTDAQGRFYGLGLPLAAGRSARTVTPAQRRALVMRDGGCVFPNCDRSPGFCQAHHAIDHWALGGRSDIDNYTLVCERDHKRAHEEGWTFEHDPDRPGLFQLRPPGGGPPIKCQHRIDRNPGNRLPL